jgi:hypothetical protein
MKHTLASLMVILSLVMGTMASVWASDDSASANSLFVETVKLIQSSQNTLNNQDKLEQLDAAMSNINQIIDRYPSSDLAVKLITGQSIGNISLDSVAKTIEEVRERAERNCYEAPATYCVLILALKLAETIEDPSSRSLSLRVIAAAQAKAGESKAAFATAMMIEDAEERTSALIGIAEAQAEAGYIEAAFATAKTIEDAGWRWGALNAIAIGQAKAGDIKAAFATVKTIEDVVGRSRARSDIGHSRALSLIAGGQVKAGDVKAAFATAKTIDDAGWRGWAMSDIAPALRGVKAE